MRDTLSPRKHQTGAGIGQQQPPSVKTQAAFLISEIIIGL